MSKKNKKVTLDLSLDSLRSKTAAFDPQARDLSWDLIAENHAGTHLSEAGQRKGGPDGGSGWDYDHGRRYITDGILGKTHNVILTADVEHCLRNAKERRDDRSVEYYENLWNDNWELDSIDGYNSESYIHAFLGSHSEVYLYDDNDPSTPVYFNELDDLQQREIQHKRELRCIRLRNIMIDEKTALFRDINESESLRNQEWRQARHTALADFVRDIANQTKPSAPVKEIFTKLIQSFGPVNVDRRVHEEMVAMLALKIQSNYTSDLSKNPLHDFYEENVALTPATEKRAKEVLLTCAGIAKSLPSPNGLSQKVTKNVVHNLWDMIDCLIGNNYKITDPYEFMNWYLSVHTTSWVASEAVPSGDQEDLSYRYWTTYCARKTYYSKIRQLFNDQLMFTADALESAGVIKKKRTTQDRFNFDTKLKLWTLQDHRDRNDTEIKAIDLYLGKTHADHVRSVQEGGDTTLGNAELMLSLDNLKKGSSSNLPHFPHQQDFAFEGDEE
mgnify:CR=1 FL=1